VGGQTEFINNDGTGWSGITALSLTLAGGYKENPTAPEPRSFITNGEDGLTFHTGASGQQACIQGDLKVSGKIIVDQELEDSSGNAVGGSGAWSGWLDINVPSAAQHFGPSGSGVYDVNFHTHVPGAIEVFIEAHVGEAYLQYWNVYTASWTTIISAPDNYGMNGGCCIRLAPGYYDPSTGTAGEITHPPSTLQVIAPGTVKFRAFMAAGDEITADVIWVKIRRWR